MYVTLCDTVSVCLCVHVQVVCKLGQGVVWYSIYSGSYTANTGPKFIALKEPEHHAFCIAVKGAFSIALGQSNNSSKYIAIKRGKLNVHKSILAKVS